MKARTDLFIKGTGLSGYFLNIESRSLRGFPLLPESELAVFRYQRDERKLGPHPNCPRDGGFAFWRMGFFKS